MQYKVIISLLRIPLEVAPIFRLLRGCSDLELCLTNNPEQQGRKWKKLNGGHYHFQQSTAGTLHTRANMHEICQM